MGLLAICEAGRDEAVRGLVALEMSVGESNVKLAYFRGFESLLKPDVMEILPRKIFGERDWLFLV